MNVPESALHTVVLFYRESVYNGGDECFARKLKLATESDVSEEENGVLGVGLWS
jgi:hypothetical protein